MHSRHQYLAIIFLLAVCGAISGCGHHPSSRLLGDRKLSTADKKEIFARLDSQIKSYMGVPYKLGGTTGSGLDCSGLVWVAYRDAAGITLPRRAEDMYRTGMIVQNGRWKFGDLLFFSFKGVKISHVGIYIGARRFVHVSQSFGTTVSSLSNDYYKKRFRGARRIIR